MSNRAWSIVDIAALCLIPLTFLGAWRWAWFQDQAAAHPARILALQIVLLLTFAFALGKSKDRTWLGVLIDESDRVSLGRLQAFLWTVIILGGIAAAMTVNLARECAAPEDGVDAVAGTCAESPFSIEIPTEVLTLAGITAATLAASSVLTNQGLTSTLNPFRAAQLPASRSNMNAGYTERGVIAARSAPVDATLGDLVRGKFLSDNASLDLTRIQFLAITLILAGAYLVAFAQGMSLDPSQSVGTFPAVDAGLNVLLGISAGTYAGLSAVKEAVLKE